MKPSLIGAAQTHTHTPTHNTDPRTPQCIDTGKGEVASAAVGLCFSSSPEAWLGNPRKTVKILSWKMKVPQ